MSQQSPTKSESDNKKPHNENAKPKDDNQANKQDNKLSKELEEKIPAMFAKLEKQFLTYVGPKALEDLKSYVTKRPVLTIGGDQLTGKSTLSKLLAEHFKGEAMSAGVIFRAVAKERGLTVAQLSQQAKDSPQIDIDIEYKLCRKIAEGIEKGVLIIEGRQPAVMATYMKYVFKKEKCVRVFLSCSYRDQAIRFIRREIGEETAKTADEVIPRREFASLAEISAEIEKLHIPKAVEGFSQFVDNQNRDQHDHQRYSALYGFPDEIDYRKPRDLVYDVVVPPSDVEGTFNAVIGTLQQKFPEWYSAATEVSK